MVAQTITVTPKLLLPRTSKSININPDLIRAACMEAVQREGTPIKQIQLLSVSVVPTKDERGAACVVSGRMMEGPGVSGSGIVTATEVLYSGWVNVETGKVDLARIDEDAANQAALNELAAMFIKIKPTAITPDKITYTALIAGKKCVIEVKNDMPPYPKRWLVTKLDCKR